MFEKIIGYESIKKEVSRICDIVSNCSKYRKLGVSLPHGLLFYGEPGVGKTLFATCFLEASQRKSFVIRKNMPDKEFVKHIKDIFEEAKKNTPAIILLDDMDKFANNDSSCKNAEEYITIQSCFDDIKAYDIFVVATANSLHRVPDSLLRVGRFDNKIEINRPKNEDSEKIIAHYLKSKNYVSDINVKQLAKLLNGSTCAELECIINQAGIYAGYNNKEKIEFDDLVKACIRKIYEAPETINNGSKKDDELTAYHEAGHAVVAELLEPGSVTMISIGGYEGSISGFTAYYRTEEYWRDIEKMKNRVMCLLGGKCAVEIQYGIVDVGCISDMERAAAIINRFVTQYGSLGWSKYSPDAFGVSVHQKFLQEASVGDELARFYQQTKELLVKNKKLLDKMAKAVNEKKLIIENDIKEIVDSI